MCVSACVCVPLCVRGACVCGMDVICEILVHFNSLSKCCAPCAFSMDVDIVVSLRNGLLRELCQIQVDNVSTYYVNSREL